MPRDIVLDGLRVRLGEPRQVLEGVGYLWFPNIARFASGKLMLTAIATADTHDNLVNGYRVTGTAALTSNGAVAPFSGSPVTVDVTGGNALMLATVKLTFGGAAAGHFGDSALTGVVSIR